MNEIAAAIIQLQRALAQHSIGPATTIAVDPTSYRQLRSMPDVNRTAVWFDAKGRDGIRICDVEFVEQT
jgi:hypothetical protein